MLHAPAWLYAAGWGRLLGHRFLALTHRGRRSGRRYTTVLEVLCSRPERGEAVVVVQRVLSRLSRVAYDGSARSREQLVAELPLLGLRRAGVDPPRAPG
jgi:hypothetical protein